MHLRVDCIQCLCSQENHNLPCQCLQLSIKVFSAFFVCARRNGTGCPVLRAVSTTMGKRGPGPAVNARARRRRCWQSVFAGQRTLTETFLGKRVQVEDKVPAVQGSPSTEANHKRILPAHRMQQAGSATSVTPCSTRKQAYQTRVDDVAQVEDACSGCGRGCQAVEGGLHADCRPLWCVKTRRMTYVETMDVPTVGAVHNIDTVEQCGEFQFGAPWPSTSSGSPLTGHGSDSGCRTASRRRRPMRGVWCRGVSWLSAQEEPRWPGVRRRWDPWPTTSGHGRGRRLLRRVQSAWLLCQWRLVLLQALQVVGWLQWPADQIMVSSAAANQGFTAATGRDKLCEWNEEEQALATTVKIDVSDHRTNMAIREFIGGHTQKIR